MTADLHEDYGMSKAEREGRYFGFMEGVITTVDDDAKLGRVKARLASMDFGEESDWLLPFWPGSMECIPRKGDAVLVGFINGDPNNGFYGWHPQTVTKDRPTEPGVLGKLIAGVINGIAKTLSTVMTDFYTTHITSEYNSHQHTYIYGTTMGPVTPSMVSKPADPPKVKDADGNKVSEASDDTVALSSRVKVGP